MHALLPKKKKKRKKKKTYVYAWEKNNVRLVSLLGFIYDCNLIPCLLGMVKSRYPTNTGLLHPMGQILSVV
jgi:hypothetical protein